MKFASCISALLCCVAGISPCQADGESSTAFSGFGTLGAVYNSHPETGFVRDVGQEGKFGRRVSLLPDSRLGLQVTHTVSPQLQVVGQLLLRDQVGLSLGNSISRAFISYRPTPNAMIRLGRMADSTFMISDYMDVGYAYPWVRPPMDAYGFMLVHHYDGADFTYSIPQGENTWRLKAMAGRIVVHAAQLGDPTEVTSRSRGLWGVAGMFERGGLKVRLGYTDMKVKMDDITRGLRDGLTTFAAMPGNPYAVEASAYADSLETESSRVGYSTLGFVYDSDRWMFQGEVSKLSSNSFFIPHGTQGYLTLGYHIDNFLPFVSVAKRHGNPLARAHSDWSVLGPEAAYLQQGTLMALNATRMEQKSFSLGMRWDFDSRAAFKLQWDRNFVEAGGWGFWWNDNSTGAVREKGHVDLVSATLDFVF